MTDQTPTPSRHEHSAGYGVTRKFPADEAPKPNTPTSSSKRKAPAKKAAAKKATPSRKRARK